jgi:hypothetical protein
MVIISNKLLTELRQILQEDYGLKVNAKEALEIGTTLLNFTETLMKIESENYYQNEKQQTIKTS